MTKLLVEVDEAAIETVKRRAVEVAIEVLLPILSAEQHEALRRWAKDQGVEFA